MDKTYERLNEKTPNGGDYSEVFYLDEDGKPADKEVAVTAVVRECMNDGSLIMETIASLRDSQ